MPPPVRNGPRCSTTLLDLDALSKAEGKKWVWKGLTCLSPEDRLCLIALSEGGEDAIEYREFDLQTGQFVPNGLRLSTSKQGAAWLDKDTLLVSRDWGRDADQVQLPLRREDGEAGPTARSGDRDFPGADR